MWKWPTNCDSDKLDIILKEMKIMATTLAQQTAQLDAALAANTTAVSMVVADVTALIAKINSSPVAADFTSELNAVQSSISELQGADASAQAVLNPPAAPSS